MIGMLSALLCSLNAGDREGPLFEPVDGLSMSWLVVSEPYLCGGSRGGYNFTSSEECIDADTLAWRLGSLGSGREWTVHARLGTSTLSHLKVVHYELTDSGLHYLDTVYSGSGRVDGRMESQAAMVLDSVTGLLGWQGPPPGLGPSLFSLLNWRLDTFQIDGRNRAFRSSDRGWLLDLGDSIGTARAIQGLGWDSGRTATGPGRRNPSDVRSLASSFVLLWKGDSAVHPLTSIRTIPASTAARSRKQGNDPVAWKVMDREGWVQWWSARPPYEKADLLRMDGRTVSADVVRAVPGPYILRTRTTKLFILRI